MIYIYIVRFNLNEKKEKKNNMKKSDLECGNVVEIRNGDKLLFCRNFVGVTELLYLTGTGYLFLDNYHEDFTEIDDDVDFDIMKVYKDYTCKELLWERKEKPQLTEDEKVILRNVPKHYKWIARDLSGMVYIFIERPEKGQAIWYGCGQPMIPFYHLFQFIKWEDEEPYLIEELLKGENNG